MATSKRLTSLEGTAFYAGDVGEIVAGNGITVDSTDPTKPIVSASGGGGAEWGEITGTLADQTDLDAALDAKADTFTTGNLVAGTNITLDGTLTDRLIGVGDVIVNASGGGGGGSPVGSDTEIQINDSGSFGGSGILSTQIPGGLASQSTLLKSTKALSFVSGADAVADALPSIVGMFAGAGINFGSIDGPGASLLLQQSLYSGGVSSSAAVISTVDTDSDGIQKIELGESSITITSTNYDASINNWVEIGSSGITASTPRNRQLPSFTVANLATPSTGADSTVGAIAFATDGRKEGESAGNGTGVPVWSDGTSWLTFYDNTAVEA